MYSSIWLDFLSGSSEFPKVKFPKTSGDFARHCLLQYLLVKLSYRATLEFVWGNNYTRQGMPEGTAHSEPVIQKASLCIQRSEYGEKPGRGCEEGLRQGHVREEWRRS